MEKFCAEIIRRATHQTLAAAGFEKSSRIGGDVLADVFKEYLMFLGKSAQEAATNAGRTKVNTTDILIAFEDLGINLEELKEWTKTEGKVLGGYAGRKPTVLKDLLRSGLPNEVDDVDLSIIETKEKDEIKQNGQSSKKEDIVDIVQEIQINEQSIKKLESKEIENNIKEVEDNMIIDIEGTLSQNNSQNNKNNDNETASLSTAEDKSSDSLSGQTTPKDDGKITNINGEITKERIESNSPMQIDSIVKQTTDRYSRLLLLSKKRPPYIPDWLPPLPEVKPRKENEPVNEVQNVGVEEKTKELSGLTESTTLTEKEKPIDDMITSQESISEIQESNNINVDSNVQIKPSKQKLKRPLAYTMLDELFEKALTSESALGELSFDTPRKKRKIVEFDNLLSFEDSLFSESEIPVMDDKNTRELVESYGYPLRLNETPIQKHKSIELASKVADVNLKAPVQIIDTILPEVKPSKPLQIKSPVSRKGKEKMIPEIIDFQEPEPSTESPKALKKKEPMNIKAKKSTYKGATMKSDVPEKLSESNRPKLTLRIKSATTPSDPEPSEVINCICAPPNNTLDDGKFMVSCDNCQEWFHGVCTGFGPHHVDVGTWFCPRCRDRGIS
ncbi:hypothetical protein C1645_831724 [Glomus cerebriforme]|uniref:PHD-type domain-containing protein n=1 Tax=Glomus cerebriforme TaxID=658196 RepID=A0A397SIU0_9GLOM|nr:hypothetical protein C1645_831724 [Glomus cerebriforme]